MDMHGIDIHRIDLNLLTNLKVLLDRDNFTQSLV